MRSASVMTSPGPRRVAGEESRDADERRAVRHSPGVQVAARAIQLVADVLRQQGPGLQVQSRAPHQLLRIGLQQHLRQARRLEGRRIHLRIELGAQLFHLGSAQRRGVIAPNLAYEAEDFGQFLIGQPAERGHGVDPGVCSRFRRLPSRQDDVNEGCRIGGRDRRVAGKPREYPFHAGSILSMAIDAELDVAQAARRGEQAGGNDGRCAFDRHRWHGNFLLARRQRLQVRGDGHEISIAEVLRAVVDDLDHAARNAAEAVLPGLEHLDGVGHRPEVAQAGRPPRIHRFAGQIELAWRAVVGHGLFLEADAARRVAGPAMSQPLDQVSAAVPRIVAGCVGLERNVFDESPVPERQTPAHVERPGHLRWLVGPVGRGQPVHEIPVQRPHVVRGHLGVRRVRHRRIQVVSIGGNALAHGAIELLERVVAYSGPAVRRDVGRIEHPERRLKREPPGHCCSGR